MISTNMKLQNPCVKKRDFCVNCHSHFMTVRPSINTVVVTGHFIKDMKDTNLLNSVVNDILDCSHMEFHELHKFEEHINGNLIFRAKTEQMHIVYCIDKKLRIIFLRAFKNYKEYGKFLENKTEINNMITHV